LIGSIEMLRLGYCHSREQAIGVSGFKPIRKGCISYFTQKGSQPIIFAFGEGLKEKIEPDFRPLDQGQAAFSK